MFPNIVFSSVFLLQECSRTQGKYMHHIFDQDDLLLLAHIVCKSEVVNKDTSHSYIFDAYSQDTHDSSYPFYYMCVNSFQSNYSLKGLHAFRGSMS